MEGLHAFIVSLFIVNIVSLRRFHALQEDLMVETVAPHSGSDVAPERCEPGRWIHAGALSTCPAGTRTDLTGCWRGIRLPSMGRHRRQGTAQVTMVTQRNKVSWWCWTFLSKVFISSQQVQLSLSIWNRSHNNSRLVKLYILNQVYSEI